MNLKKIKKGQEVKMNFPCLTSKRGQEEIIGFGIILLLIAIIGVIFISMSINKNSDKGELQDYETGSFLKAMLETTTTCEKNAKYVSVKDLIFECQRNYICYDNENSCNVLNKTIREIMDESWVVGNNTSIKGYELTINSYKENMVNLTKGDITSTYKGASQNYAKSTDEANLFIKIYT